MFKNSFVKVFGSFDCHKQMGSCEKNQQYDDEQPYKDYYISKIWKKNQKISISIYSFIPSQNKNKTKHFRHFTWLLTRGNRK